jgi:hypothetical protein
LREGRKGHVRGSKGHWDSLMRDVCTVSEPLWRLTKNGVPWQWTEAEQNAFDAIKKLNSTKCMGYFRKDWETELGAVICRHLKAADRDGAPVQSSRERRSTRSGVVMREGSRLVDREPLPHRSGQPRSDANL